jgi:hypothetical protein
MAENDQADEELFADALADDIAVPGAEKVAEAPIESAPAEAKPETPTEATEAPALEKPEAGNDEAPAIPAEPQMPENIPSWRLAEEANKRREAEANASQLKDAVQSLQAQIYQMAGQGQPQQNPQQQGQPQASGPIDPIEDPQGFAMAVLAEAKQQASQSFGQELNLVRLENSLARAADRHGEENFKAAYGEFVQAAPKDQATYIRVMQAGDPGEAMVQWQRERNLLTETGGDPAAYKDRVRQEMLADPAFRQSVLEAVRSEAGGNGATPANAQTVVPPSLSSVPGGSSPHGSGIDKGTDGEALFNDAIRGA